MFKIKFFIEKKLKFKISLSYSATLNDSTEVFTYYPNYNLLSNDSEIEDIIKEEDKKEKMKYFYFNRIAINDLSNEQIDITQIIQKKYSEYFYLALLIEDNTVVVNYKYSLEFIKEINGQIKEAKNNNLKEFMMSKILLVLINNYRQTDEYDENYEDEIKELEKFNTERIKSNIYKLKDIKLNSEIIENKKIDEIYIEIIMDLINTYKIDDIKYANDIMMQLDIENIEITKTIYDGLASILKSDNNYMKKYIISNEKDLYNDDIINFYYILFKYILKKPIYIYQIQFLNEIRKKILSIIKEDKGKINNEKLEYIINFFTYDYYAFLLNKLHTKKDKSKSKYNDNSTTKVKSHLSLSVQSTSSSLDNNNNSIIKFEEHIDISSKENYTRLIREMSNGDIIRLHNTNDITIYKKDKDPKIIKCDSISSTQKEMKTNCNTNKRINLEKLKADKAFKEKKNIDNIIETNESIKKKDNNFIQVMECSKEGLMIYNLSDNQKIIVNTLEMSCIGCFEIKDNNYVIIGEKGIVHYKDLSNLEELPYKCEKVDNFEEKNLPFRGCIKINDNYIALTSNSILSNGKDILFIYDTIERRFINEIEFSFVVGVNGLHLMDIVEDEDKNQKKNQILLCACKKYHDLQKNGIIIINTNNIKEKEEFSSFYDTDAFEVSCFCPLKIQKDFKMKATNYFLAGGLDEEKRKGMIKLYRVQYNEEKEKDKIKIEFLQDIVIETNDKFTGFNSNIECMMQRQSDGKIFVSSLDGNLTLFSEPNLDYYLEENQIIEELRIQFSNG